MTDRHLETNEVVAYLERKLAPADQDRIESHLADCPECRREVIEISRIGGLGRRRRRWLFVVPAMAAAAVLVLVLGRSMWTTRSGDEPIVRNGGGDHRRTILPVAPGDESVVAAGSLTFMWRSATAATSYHVTVTDANGDVVWSTAVVDTVARLPAMVRLHGGAKYFWYVDGLLRDGTSLTTGVREFTVRP